MNKTEIYELIKKVASRPDDYNAVEELIDFITDSDTVILSAKKIKDNLQVSTSESPMPNTVKLETRLNLVQSMYADAQDPVAEDWLKDDFVNCLTKLLA
jgi:hypothetical protein